MLLLKTTLYTRHASVVAMGKHWKQSKRSNNNFQFNFRPKTHNVDVVNKPCQIMLRRHVRLSQWHHLIIYTSCSKGILARSWCPRDRNPTGLSGRARFPHLTRCTPCWQSHPGSTSGALQRTLPKKVLRSQIEESPAYVAKRNACKIYSHLLSSSLKHAPQACRKWRRATS